MTIKFKKLGVLLIPLNINIELLQKKEKKTFSVILREVALEGLETGTFEFVTNALTN